MAENTHDHHRPYRGGGYGRWVFWGFLLIAGYFLITEHRAHLSGWIGSYGIWLLLLACPLLHVFHGHGGHGGHGTEDKKDRQ
jgi:hypothetical protein